MRPRRSTTSSRGRGFSWSAIVVALLCLACGPAASARPVAITLQPVATGLDFAVGITHAGDGSGRLFITLQGGRIVIVSGTQVLPTPFLDISDRVLMGGERGLLGLAFHPSYETNGLFYVFYTSKPVGDIVIARYTVSANPNVANHDPETVLLTVPHYSSRTTTAGSSNSGPTAISTRGSAMAAAGAIRGTTPRTSARSSASSSGSTWTARRPTCLRVIPSETKSGRSAFATHGASASTA